MADYWKIYKKAKAFYFTLRIIKCPALRNEEIFFTQKGFRHLLRKNNGKRLIADQIRRFRIVFTIPEVVAKGTLEGYEKKIYKGKENHFWVLQYIHNNISIKIIIMQIDSGPKHFISIMNEP